MKKTKIVVLLIAAFVLIAAMAGIAYAQFAGAQANSVSNSSSQTPQSTTYPQQGYYPYGSTQNRYPQGYGMRMGMCARFW